MPVEVILPKVDMDMEDGSIQSWKVSEGEAVIAGQLIFEIGTNKAVMEVEAPASGIIRGISVKQGETVSVGTVVAWIYSANEAMQSPAQSNASPEQKPSATSLVPANDGSIRVTDAVQLKSPPQEIGSSKAVRATPLARRLARQTGIDLAVISGSGPRGRISERDVLQQTAASPQVFTPQALSLQLVAPAPNHALTSSGELVPFSAVRRIVAKRLTRSATTIPHFYLNFGMDMGGALSFLKRVSPGILAKTGIKPSLTAFLVHACARVLADHPYLNASVEGEAARLHTSRHIGVAMDRDGDLVVPVVRHAGEGAFIDTVRAFDTLRAAVQGRTLKPSDMEGGTFTISNLGMFGVDSFTAIINPPQTGILAVGKTVKTPWVVNDLVEIRPRATLCLSSDHRVVDGVAAAKFMADLQSVLEAPELLA